MLRELKEQFSRPVEPSVLAARNMVRGLLPYVERFYQSWQPSESSPHYMYNSRT